MVRSRVRGLDPRISVGIVLSALLASPVAAQDAAVRIIQTNAAGDDVHIIDPATNEVVDVILGIPIAHGVTSHPDGTELYFSNEVEHTLDVVSTSTMNVVAQIPLSGRPNNVAITPDGWSLHFDGGVRPMAFEANPDGSTKRIFVQISSHHGFYVVDWESRRVVEKIEQPELPLTRQSNDALQGSPAHGLAVSPDGSQLWSTSKPNSHVYAYSLPDLEYLGGVEVGHDPDWLTMTPDGRYLYSANAGSNTVTVIDTERMEAVKTIRVGQVPKRNHTAVIR